MTSSSQILVLLDGSDRSRRALTHLATLTALYKHQIILYHAISNAPQFCQDLDITPPSSDIFTDWGETENSRLFDFMTEAKAFLVDTGFHQDKITIKLQKTASTASHNILTEAGSNYDAVVFQRRGGGGVKHIIVGSVASKVLSGLVHTPVILSGKRPNNRRIIIAVDGSHSATQAAMFAGQLAGSPDYSAILLHIIRAHNLEVMPKEMLYGHKKRMLTTFMELKGALTTAGMAPKNISEKIIIGANSRANAIVEEAKKQNVNTIVMGKRGLSREQDYQMGQVCEKVIHSNRDFSVWLV